MYTLTIIVLSILSILLLVYNPKLYRSKVFGFWLAISCLVGWTEFVFFLRHDAWVFGPGHVIDWEILGTTIEDILFCPNFAVIFFKLFEITGRRFRQRVYNPDDKLILAVFAFWIALAYYDLGSQFSKYMSLRTVLGFIGMIYCWNRASFRHCLLFVTIVYCIGFFWDLPSVATRVWWYIPENGIIPHIYDGMYATILGAQFPIELFGYYFTGGFFSFWTISFLYAYFQKQNSS